MLVLPQLLKNDGAHCSNVVSFYTIKVYRTTYIYQERLQWPRLQRSNSLHRVWGDILLSILLHPHSCDDSIGSKQAPLYQLKENGPEKHKGVETIDRERGKNQLINDQSERHCTLSGRFLGIGSAVTYLWGKYFWAFVSEDNEVSAPSTCPRPWNFAKRLMTENFSCSWHSNLKSTIEALLSSLQNHKH